MKKKKVVTKEPEITLVWEFKGRAIFIAGNIQHAKEYSEYMELWFQALRIIDEKYRTPDNMEKVL
jgi:hypothetical protein